VSSFREANDARQRYQRDSQADGRTAAENEGEMDESVDLCIG
jgi:hypothetical protein